MESKSIIVPATELRKHMADYLKLVQEGEDVRVSKYGKTLVRLVLEQSLRGPEIPFGEE